MASIPISQLQPDFTIAIDEFVAIVDSGSLSTRRASVGTLNAFFAASGSNLSSSATSMSISNSFAIFTDTASFVTPTTHKITASWAVNLDSGSVAGTASLAYNARTASKLEGIGTSYENDLSINTSFTINNGAYLQMARHPELTSSTVLPQLKHNSIFLHKGYSTGGYGKIFLNDSGTYKAKLVFDLGGNFVNVSGIGPDIDTIAKSSKGILFQSDAAGSGSSTKTSSLFYARENGRTYTRYAEALEFSSSKATSGGEAFYGTASYALFSSFSLASPTQWPLGAIVGYTGTGTPSGPAWADWTGSNGQPITASTYPSLSLQITNSYCQLSSASVLVHMTNGVTPTTISVTVGGGSGLFQLVYGSTSQSFDAINGYTHNVTGTFAINSNYTYTITDYGYNLPTPSITITTHTNGTSAPDSTSIHRFGDRNEYRLPQMQTYFRKYADPEPISWLIIQKTL